MCSVRLEFSAFISMSMLSARGQRVLMLRNINKYHSQKSCRALLILVSHFEINFLV